MTPQEWNSQPFRALGQAQIAENKTANRLKGSWWATAPRDGFSQKAESEKHRMSNSRYARFAPSPILDWPV